MLENMEVLEQRWTQINLWEQVEVIHVTTAVFKEHQLNYMCEVFTYKVLLN